MSIICMKIAFQFEYCAKSHLQVVLYAWKSNILCIKNTSYDCIQYSRAFIATFRVHSIVSNIKTFGFKIFWLVVLYNNADDRYLAKNSLGKEGIENLFLLDSPWLMSLSTNVNTGSLSLIIFYKLLVINCERRKTRALYLLPFFIVKDMIVKNHNMVPCILK